jgi:hypothetical protein
MKKLISFVVVTACVATASAATAGELKLSIANGRATLVATDVPAREILAEWARIGQTKIVNGDRIVGPNLTLQLVDRPEREVLDVVLRAVAGYVAAPRNTAVATLSVYDRILILPTSQAPAYNPAAMSSPTTFQRPQMPVPMPEDDPVNHPNAPVQGAPGMPMPQGMVPQNPQTQPMPGMPQQPQTLPRPGMLPAPPPGMPNPYGPNPNPNSNPNVPGRPGGVPPGTKPPGGGN